MQRFEFDVAVLGGGISGLVAARELGRAGARVALLEARSRWGGRIYSITPEVGDSAGSAEGVDAVELGAEFVHGRPPEAVRLLREAGLDMHGIDEDWLERTDLGLSREPGFFQAVDQVLETLTREALPDRSLDRYLRERALPDELSRRVRSYVESFDAAFAERIGTLGIARERWSAMGKSDVMHRLPAGYGALVDYLVRTAERVVPLSSTIVREIHWSSSDIAIGAEASDGVRRYRFPRAIVTFPIGVLRIEDPSDESYVRFDPPLSSTSKRQALSELDPGIARRVVLHLTEPFWLEHRARDGRPLQAEEFIRAEGEQVPIFWTSATKRDARITGWVGGAAARDSNPNLLASSAVSTFARIVDVPISEIERRLRGSYAHDWLGDPWTRGAYSYARVGGGDAPRVLAEPIENTLFFAGEATHFEGELGTVAAAIATGIRAASEVLSLR